MQAVVLLLRIMSLLPLNILYLIADALAWALRDLFRYRKEIVELNLRRSFPEKSKEERRVIMREFYTYIADVMIETVKLHSISVEALRERVVFKEPHLLQRLADDGKNVILLMGHSGNWEWAGCATAIEFGVHILPVYRKVKNDPIDLHFKALRSRFGATPILDKEAFRLIKGHASPHAVALLADHTPGAGKGLWIEFLDQQAPFYRGTEVLLKRLDYEVLFAHVRITGRGRYEIHFEPYKATGTNDFEVTRAFVEFLEREIHAQPFNWLWSHKRWKHRKPERAISIER
ncbi:MAG: lysophospholipid acyltransferase family protein [Flavobacteriales bacterium]|nr:lysophospholipid acyltransferase family protein [Flavobacteriales bacterium]